MEGGQKADKSSSAGKTCNGLKIASAKTWQNQEKDTWFGRKCCLRSTVGKFLTCGPTSDILWCGCVRLQCPSLNLFQFVLEPRASPWLKCLGAWWATIKRKLPCLHTAPRFLHSAAIHGAFKRVRCRGLWGLAGWWSETVEERGCSMHNNAPCNVTCVANKCAHCSRTAVVGTPLFPIFINFPLTPNFPRG